MSIVPALRKPPSHGRFRAGRCSQKDGQQGCGDQAVVHVGRGSSRILPMSTDRTRILVKAAGNGDIAALEEPVDRHLPRLHAYVRLRMGSKLRSREASEDVVQSVCREVLEDLDGFEYRGEGSFLHWLFAAALNKMRERARFHGQKKRDLGREVAISDSSAQAYSPLATPSCAAISAEGIDRIERVFARLPDDYREVITLTKIAGVPYPEVAAHLGRNEPAMRMLLGRALAKFAEELEKDSG